MPDKIASPMHCLAARNAVVETEQPQLPDSALYDYYGRTINQTYPLFLKKLGLDHSAIRAEGATITDAEGKEYIDCVGGYGVFNLGHNHPVLIQSLIDQLQQKNQVTRPLITELPVRLAESISSLTGGALPCSFVCNSGSEAIDNALKLARLHKGKKQIIAARGSFHGYTCGALSVSGIPAFKRPFEPLMPDIDHVPFGDIGRLKNAVSDKTAAVLLEPVQHEAGVVLPPAGYFREVRSICDEKDILLIIDEVKTGLGKTGRMLGCEHFGVLPDVLVLGKSLGGGLMPIGAMAGKEKLWKKFALSFSMSASSYAGNALACRAAITTITLMQDGELIAECAEKGRILLNGLRDLAGRYPALLKQVEGLGLLIGLEAVHPRIAIGLTRELIRRGVLALPAFGNGCFVMVEPPLVLTPEQLRAIITALQRSCEFLDRKAEEPHAGM